MTHVACESKLCSVKVLQYSIAAPLASSIGCRWGAAVLPDRRRF